jgi:hypothetical protein
MPGMIGQWLVESFPPPGSLPSVISRGWRTERVYGTGRAARPPISAAAGRPADVIGNAVKVMHIATGEVEEKATRAATMALKDIRADQSGRAIFGA